ncbi:O-antigen ligase family protein [Oleiharenicola lentus]|uniref:O-antigen ligase family protein n=1 Tax=Oleiharenicola lentus TaxID=2508720 RepID=UPI003F66B288
MDPRLRTLLFGAAAVALATWVGASIAQEDFFLAALTAVLCVWAVLSWTRGPFAEAWLLGLLVFGYVIGNRGFAQMAPVSGLPVFASELGLAAVLTITLLRGALRRRIPFQRDWLNTLLVLWIALGTARIGWDVRTFGFVALRDFAMIYYVLYFFAAQAVADHELSRKLLHAALIATFAFLPVTSLLVELFPDFFRAHLLVQGVPLIFYKGDLLATFLFTGFILMLPKGEFKWGETWWRWLLALTGLAFGLSMLSRASMMGLAVAIGWLARSGRWRPLQALVGVCALGLIGITAGSLLQKKDFTQTKAYAIYEAVASIVDVSGTRVYQSDLSSDKGDNNRFRLVWWKNVSEETLSTSPVFGLGFGADLARGFLLEYYPTEELDFTTRSPHNIFITTLGRMGLVGVVCLLAVYWVQARSTARVARRARGNDVREREVTLQAACWVIMISACFGVVLEGPMGAIPFWIMLGLAHFEATRPIETET